MPTLTGIAYKDKKRGPMHELDSVKVTLESGVANDIFGRPGKRQVTLLSSAQWQQACSEIAQDLNWLTRRANLLVDGYQFSAADVGKTVHIGAQLQLEITGETDPCAKMEQAVAGLEAALTPEWRGGVTAKVVNAGEISINDTVSIL
ncbi:MOSC domain-containing protein [Shewanella sp. WXL01]|uniref:MOSC domain-containing protein n=1 Tax=Shewanella sp. WXL01 TaxID=2709721 RepID=UPI0014383F0D|nr:MOSC domain-containing protein [Shewanella sp. WXL01]NKF51855.1 MOSC domain-containing protein [Shewanella sp. WXL01]